MTNNPLTSPLQWTHTLTGGQTVTLTRWGIRDLEANAADFFAFLRLFSDVARTELPVEDEAKVFGLLSRVIVSSLAKPEDETLLTAADVPLIAQDIYERNKLGDLVGGVLGLHRRIVLARVQALESDPSAAPRP